MTREERFAQAETRLRSAVNEWAELLNDPYKAPELKIGLPASVTQACWEVGISWNVLVDEK